MEKKAHTSKRVSVIACDNVISKAKLCDAYTRIFQNLQRTPKIHQILAVLGRMFLYLKKPRLAQVGFVYIKPKGLHQ